MASKGTTHPLPLLGEPTRECTPANNNNNKQLRTSSLKLPAALATCQEEFQFLADSSLVRLVSCESQCEREALLDELTALNREIAHQFSQFAEGVFFDDLGDDGEHLVHEATACFLTASLYKHGVRLGEMTGGEEEVLLSMGKRFVRKVGVPDVSFRLCHRSGGYLLDPNLLVEICYSISLSDTHRKIESYFNQAPGLMAALAVDIECPWRTLPPHDTLDYAAGKMVVYCYERPSPGTPLRASHAVSFGNIPLTAEDLLRAREITGVCEESFRGYGVCAQDPPCNAAGNDLYRLTVPAAHLLADDPADPLGGTTMTKLLRAVDDDIHALDWSVDLFELKKYVILHGVYESNLGIAQALGLELPHRPVL